VIFFGTVQAHSDEEAILTEESCPGFVEQQAVRLQIVADQLRRQAIALLIGHDPLEKIDARQEGLPLRPLKITIPPRAGHFSDSGQRSYPTVSPPDDGSAHTEAFFSRTGSLRADTTGCRRGIARSGAARRVCLPAVRCSHRGRRFYRRRKSCIFHRPGNSCPSTEHGEMRVC